MKILEVESMPVICGVPESHWKCTFGNFDFTDNDDLLKITEKFLAGDKHFWLYLHGPTGRGKTHFAVALHRALVAQKGFEGTDSSIFIPFTKLCEELKASLSDYSYEERLRAYLDSECLFIDDIIGKRTEFEVRILEDIVRERHASEKRLVITSNERFVGFTDLFNAHEVSRIQSVTVGVEVAGRDRRVD